MGMDCGESELLDGVVGIRWRVTHSADFHCYKKIYTDNSRCKDVYLNVLLMNFTVQVTYA